MLRTWLELARISNLPTVWTNVLAAWLLAGGKWEARPLALLLGGGSLIYTAGMILNDAADAKWDRAHRPERPIPSGRASPKVVWSAGLLFLAAGFAMMVWGAQACIWLSGTLVAAILFYDFYHKQWTGSVLVMGSCRTLLYLAAASAVTGGLTWHGNHLVILWAIALGAYIVGVSLAARSESKARGTDSLSGVLGWFCLSLPGLLSLDFFFFDAGKTSQQTSLSFSWALLPFGALVIWACRTMRSSPSHIGRAVGSLLAGIVFVDSLAVTAISPVTALAFALSFPLLLMWQRKIAAT